MSIFRPRWKREAYSDTRGGKRDPEREKQSELDKVMQNYPLWRDLFDGTALKEKL